MFTTPKAPAAASAENLLTQLLGGLTQIIADGKVTKGNSNGVSRREASKRIVAAIMSMRPSSRANDATSTGSPTGFGGSSGGSASGNLTNDEDMQARLPKSWSIIEVIRQPELQKQSKFLDDAKLWGEIAEMVSDILEEYDMIFVNDYSGENDLSYDSVLDTLVVQRELVHILVTLCRDILTLGYARVGFPRDHLKWVMDARVWDQVEASTADYLLKRDKRITPSISSLPGYKKLGPMRGRLPISTALKHRYLPYVRLDPFDGDLVMCRDPENPTTPCAFFMPRSKAGKEEEEKYWRHIVIVSSTHPPKRGGITTGIDTLHKLYKLRSLEMANGGSASTWLSRPLIPANFVAEAKSIEEQTEGEMSATIQTFDLTIQDPLERDAQYRRASTKMTPFAAAITSKLMTLEEQKQGCTRTLASIIEQRKNAAGTVPPLTLPGIGPVGGGAAGDLNGINGGGGGGAKPLGFNDLLIDDIDAAIFEAYNIDKYIGKHRSNVTILMPDGVATGPITPAQVNLDWFEKIEMLYEIEKLTQFPLLKASPGFSGSASPAEALGGGGSKSKNKTNAQVMSDENSKMSSKKRVLKIICEIFNTIHAEAGGILDYFHLSDIIAILSAELDKFDQVKALREYVLDTVAESDITMEDLITLIAHRKSRSSSSRNSDGLSKRQRMKQEGEEELAKLTLDSLKQWDAIAHSFVGISRLMDLCQRILEHGPNRSVHLKLRMTDEVYNRLKSQADQERLQAGGGNKSKADGPPIPEIPFNPPLYEIE